MRFIMEKNNVIVSNNNNIFNILHRYFCMIFTIGWKIIYHDLKMIYVNNGELK